MRFDVPPRRLPATHQDGHNIDRRVPASTLLGGIPRRVTLGHRYSLSDGPAETGLSNWQPRTVALAGYPFGRPPRRALAARARPRLLRSPVGRPSSKCRCSTLGGSRSLRSDLAIEALEL